MLSQEQKWEKFGELLFFVRICANNCLLFPLIYANFLHRSNKQRPSVQKKCTIPFRVRLSHLFHSPQVKVQWTEQLVATQQQKTEAIKKETEAQKAVADAERQKRVLAIELEKSVSPPPNGAVITPGEEEKKGGRRPYCALTSNLDARRRALCRS